ncbi:MAG: hypothetical protein HOP11_07640 [Saprospiraceae bacterium]|nr:hypothetical protein [Saprospiraceae bacterium]
MNDNSVSVQLEKFYQEYNLGEEGGNKLSFVTIELGGLFHFYIPNWDARRKAVLRHDIHHLITGFESKILGELEISSWEIGSGCLNYFAAYLINSSGFLLGLLIYPKASFRAFALGCDSKNLYQLHISDQDLLRESIDHWRSVCEFDSKKIPKTGVKVLSKLTSHIALAIIIQFIIIVLSPFLIAFHFVQYSKLKKRK